MQIKKLWKGKISICAAAILFCFINSDIFYAAQATVYINNTYLEFDQPAIIENGRTLVPLRAIGENLNCQVQWNPINKNVTVNKGDTLISLYIGSSIAYVYKNGQEEEHGLDASPIIVNNRTMVPLRFISEIIGYSVSWNSYTKTVYIFENYYSNINNDNYNSYNNSNYYDNNEHYNYGYNYNDNYENNDYDYNYDDSYENNDYDYNYDDSYENNDYDYNYDDYYENNDHDSYYENDNYYDEADEDDAVEDENIRSYSDLTNEELAYMGYEALNSYRVENGVHELDYNSDLCEAAQKHAEDMALNDYFSHTSLDGRNPADRAEEYGYTYLPIGENIALSGGLPKQVVYLYFADSPGHNKNMLNENYNEVGIGYCDGYWVQLFGGGK